MGTAKLLLPFAEQLPSSMHSRESAMTHFLRHHRPALIELLHFNRLLHFGWCKALYYMSTSSKKSRDRRNHLPLLKNYRAVAVMPQPKLSAATRYRDGGPCHVAHSKRIRGVHAPGVSGCVVLGASGARLV